MKENTVLTKRSRKTPEVNIWKEYYQINLWPDGFLTAKNTGIHFFKLSLSLNMNHL